MSVVFTRGICDIHYIILYIFHSEMERSEFLAALDVFDSDDVYDLPP